MTVRRKGMLAKGLEAVGIAAVLVGLVQGVYGSDMWGELYFFLGGMLIFYTGRRMEKKLGKATEKGPEQAAGTAAATAAEKERTN
jgi:hypothetical protein